MTGPDQFYIRVDDRLTVFQISRRVIVQLLVLIALAGGLPAVCGEIHDAARTGDVAKVQALLKDNPDLLSSKDKEGNTPLEVAVNRNHSDVVALLLANKADVNAKDGIGCTVLDWAALWGHKDIVALLLANKADVNTRADDGTTPLHLAAREGHKDVVALLLAGKADVNARDKFGMTPLHMAAQENHKDVVDLLLQSLSVTTAQILKAFSYFVVSIGGTLILCVFYLRSKRETHLSDSIPLHLPFIRKMYPWLVPALLCGVVILDAVFAVKGYKKVAELLVAKNALVNARSNDGTTPLLAAAASRNVNKEVLQLLLASKADVNVKDNNGTTPLLFAVARSAVSKDLVELLLANKADVNATGSNGVTPLHYVAANGRKDLGELLLASNAEVNAKADNAVTPLHFAAFNARKGVVELLLANKADVNVSDSNGATPLHYAARGGAVRLVSQPDFAATRPPGYIDYVLWRQAAGQAFLATVVAPSNGSVAGLQEEFIQLDTSVAHNNTSVAGLLLASKAEINAKDKHGYTPLDYAVAGGREEAAELLRQRGGHELGFDSSAIAQGEKTPLGSVIDKNKIESMMRAHVLYTLGNESVSKELLQIATVNGAPFYALPYTFGVEFGGFEFTKNLMMPKVGAEVYYRFLYSTIVVSGTWGGFKGDGGEISTIRSLDVAEGTRVQLKDGGTYLLRGGRWTKISNALPIAAVPLGLP